MDRILLSTILFFALVEFEENFAIFRHLFRLTFSNAIPASVATFVATTAAIVETC